MEEGQPSIENRQSLLGLGRPWTRVGYFVLAFAVIAFVLNLVIRPLVPVQVLIPLEPSSSAAAGTTIAVTPKGRVAIPAGFEMAFVDGSAQAYPKGYRLVGGGKGGAALKPTVPAMISVFSMVSSALLGFVWTFVDLIDRRKRFVWLLPIFVCPLVFSLQALPLALYLFFGRETLGHSEGVQ